jgi:hypothetical protein
MRFVPAIGLLLASPVVWQAVQGLRPVHEALLVWLLAMLLVMAGWWLWSVVTRPPAVPSLATAPLDGAPRRRREDTA